MKKIIINSVLFVAMVMLFGACAQTSPKGKVKDFSLKATDGTTFSLANMPEAKGFILVFTCNHCPFAQKYEDRIIALDKKYAPLGYPVIAINPNDPVKAPDDSFDNMVKRAKEKGYTFPYLLDETQEVAKFYGATRTPQVYLLARNGSSLSVVYSGAIDDNVNNPGEVRAKYVEDILVRLQSGEKVDYIETKAVGCSIKWKS